MQKAQPKRLSGAKSRLALAAALLAGGMLLAGPAAAQTNSVLDWTGVTDANWDTPAPSNWTITGGSANAFADGDIVNFTADDQRPDISLNGTTPSVAGMYVSGDQDYKITGDSIIFTTNSSSWSVSDTAAGERLVLGARATDSSTIDASAVFSGTLDLTDLTNGLDLFNASNGGVDIYTGTLRISNKKQMGESLFNLNLLGDLANYSALDAAISANNNVSDAVTSARNAGNLPTLEIADNVDFDSDSNTLSINGTAGSLHLQDGVTAKFEYYSHISAISVDNGLLALTAAGGGRYQFTNNFAGHTDSIVNILGTSRVYIEKADFDNSLMDTSNPVIKVDGQNAATRAALVLNDVTFNVSSSAVSVMPGSALYSNLADVYISDSAFTNNANSLNGGAIYMRDSNLSLIATDGKTTLFSGNTANGNPNSIYIDTTGSAYSAGRSGTLTVTAQGSGVVDMQDPFSVNLAKDYVFVNITKTGDGIWFLGGESVIDDIATTGARADIAINEGTLHLYGDDGNSIATGKITSKHGFVLNNGATLEAGSSDDSDPNVIDAATVTLNTGSTLKAGAADSYLTLKANGSTAIAITGNVNVAAGNSQTLNLQSGFSGTGGLTKIDSGTVMLNHANNYSGITNVSAGTLQAGAANAFSSASVFNVASGATLNTGTANAQTIAGLTGSGTVELGNNLTIDTAADQTFSGAFTGNGDFIKAGAATQTLAGTAVNPAMNYTINTGTLKLAPVDGDFSLTGSLNIDSGGALTLENTPGTMAIRGQVSGDGDININNASVNLVGEASGFGGMVDLVAGKLYVNSNLGSLANLSAMNVGSGALLGGSGNIYGNVANSGGTVSPGNSIGTLTITGNYAGTGVLEVEVDPTDAASADLLRITGTADLAGTVVKHIGLPENLGKYSLTGMQWRILAADGGIVSKFDSVESSFWFLDVSLVYDDVDMKWADLAITRNQVNFPDLAQTGNQYGSGKALESLDVSSDLITDLVQVDQSTSIPWLLDQLSGEIHATTAGNLQNYDRTFGKALRERIMVKNFLDEGYPLWVTFDAHAARNQSTGNTGKASFEGAGITLGTEANLTDDIVLGGAFRYGKNSVDIDSRNSGADLKSYSISLYGGWDVAVSEMGKLRFALGGAYGYHEVETTRDINVAPLNQHLKADYDARSIQFFGEVAYSFNLAEHFRAEPYAGVAWNSIHTESFTEKGGNAALHAKSQTNDNVSSTLGVRVEYSPSDTFALRGDIGWQHIYGDRNPEARLNFAGGSSFTIEGAPYARDALGLNFGAEMKVTESMRVTGGYEGLIGNDYQSHGGKLSFIFAF